MDNLYLKNLVDNNQVFDKETKTFYNKLNKHINIFNNKLNELRTCQYIIDNHFLVPCYLFTLYSRFSPNHFL